MGTTEYAHQPLDVRGLVAERHQPQARGKTKMQALVPTMRKLLHTIFGMFKHNQPFEGTKVYALAAPTPPATPEPEEVLCY